MSIMQPSNLPRPLLITCTQQPAWLSPLGAKTKRANDEDRCLIGRTSTGPLLHLSQNWLAGPSSTLVGGEQSSARPKHDKSTIVDKASHVQHGSSKTAFRAVCQAAFRARAACAARNGKSGPPVQVTRA